MPDRPHAREPPIARALAAESCVLLWPSVPPSCHPAAMLSVRCPPAAALQVWPTDVLVGGSVWRWLAEALPAEATSSFQRETEATRADASYPESSTRKEETKGHQTHTPGGAGTGDWISGVYLSPSLLVRVLEAVFGVCGGAVRPHKFVRNIEI